MKTKKSKEYQDGFKACYHKVKVGKIMSDIIEFFNDNYDTNNEVIVQHLTNYIHSSHLYCSRKMDGSFIIRQPSWPDKTVKEYKVFYNYADFSSNHKSGRIMLYFTDNTEYEIGLYKFKRYLRRITSLLMRYN